MARYRIMHRTRYDYASEVTLSQQLLHLQPRPLPWQSLLASSLHITPAGARQQDRVDAFGNPCLALAFARPHQQLDIHVELDIEVRARPLPELRQSLAWEAVVDAARYRGAPLPDTSWLEALRYRQESPHVHINHDFADYAADCFPAGRPLLLAVQALMHKIHREFRFDADATDIGTPLSEVLAEKRGVCQDFAHLMIACLRARGLPARYISGYLLTQPPPGQKRLIGADASHAWVSAWCPQLGWVDFDPTNGVLPADQHITMAWGRDFSDVSPLRGVIQGGGAHQLKVEVTVIPLENSD